MVIYFFTKPSNDCMIFTVGFMTDDGERSIGALWEQGGRHYVIRGSKISGDFQRFDFTDNQERELKKFRFSTDANREYWSCPVK